MKMLRVQLLMAALISVLMSCSSVIKTYESFSDWDSNQNNEVERREFVDAYVKQDYFDKWTSGGSISYQELFETTFSSIDINKDSQLSFDEFNSGIRNFYFGLFNGTFGEWDDDANGALSKSEFHNHVSNTNLSSLWDTNKDSSIERHEIAGGMFYICDLNSNGTIDQTELAEWRKRR